MNFIRITQNTLVMVWWEHWAN